MCAGDVCEEGSVLFTQKVHHKFDKMKKSGKIMGRRTVVGHVVKESYGTAKQQHSFTYDKTKHLDTYVNSHPVVDGGSIEEVSSPERVLSFPAIFTLPQVGSTMFGANVVGNTSSWTMNPKAELKTVSLTLPQMPVCAA